MKPSRNYPHTFGLEGIKAHRLCWLYSHFLLSMPKRKDLSQLLEEFSEIKAQIKQCQQKEKAEQRRIDNRKKILIAAMIEACLINNIEVVIKSKEDLKTYMDAFLVRDYERSLFGLAPKSSN